MVGVTGGKLTTFRVTARQVLAEAARQLPALRPGSDAPVFARSQESNPVHLRLCGRYGAAAEALLREASAEELEPIEGTPYSWAELRWALRHESVVHLDDLLMRRTRIGLVMPQGGSDLLAELLDLCWAELGWDEARCAEEEARYRAYWQQQHSVTGA